uniref:EOG090X021B n=1 Tax=Lynceus sp. MCZ IZ 141354 TaxID=1930659 RepID=A0A9N6WSJ0_9CRUS|nr:EOG090X021B [Lynceus sp. MCZ IZ 141354]
MMFPDTRVLQCANSDTKKEWLDAFDATKKSKLKVNVKEPKSYLVNTENELSNPFGDDDDVEGYHVNNQEPGVPDWLTELTDDLDVYIAQRDFEEAVNLMERSTEFWHSATEAFVSQHRELKAKIESRMQSLTDTLMHELRINPDKSIHGNPRAARRASILLVRLDKATQASDLFLKHRSATLKHSLRQIKTEGAVVLYIQQLCSVFFPFLIETEKEVTRIFCDRIVCYAAFVVWAKLELNRFGNYVKKHVFTPQSTLGVIAKCIGNVRKECLVLMDMGLDMSFALEAEVATSIERCLRESRDKLIDAIKLRALEDKWKPINLASKNGVQRFVDDMKDIGISTIAANIYDEVWVALTSNTVQFTRVYLNFLEDVLQLWSPEFATFIDVVLADVLRAQMVHTDKSLKSGKYDAKFVLKNAVFLGNSVMELAEKRCLDVYGYPSMSLGKLRSECEPLIGKRSQESGFV